MLEVLAFVLGGSVGSFLGLAADRIPEGRSIVKPRSFCECCKRSLGSLDMVPILSYLWLRGRCRQCGARIPLRLLGVEVVVGALFAVVYLQHGFGVEFAILCAAISLMVLVALIDLEHQLILNRITFPSVVVLLVVAPFWTELGLPRSFLGSESIVASLLNSLLTGMGCLMAFLVLALAYPKGMGMGDVKLAGVIGLMVGFPGALVGFWISVVSGGIVAIGLLAARKVGRKDQIPYGPFLALGAITALLAGSEIISLYNDVGDYLAGL